MRFEEFLTSVGAIEIDPREKIKRCAANIIDQELRRHGLTDDQCERFAAPALQTLYDGAKRAIERGNYAAIDQLLISVELDLRQRVMRERGELRPVSPENQIKDNLRALSDRLYRVMEIDAIRNLLRDGERIVQIGWHDIQTDRQVILRRDLPKVCRPVSFRNGNEWRRQFVSDSEIEEAIAAEQRRNQPIRMGTPSPWVE
jgi:hypothetical protein